MNVNVLAQDSRQIEVLAEGSADRDGAVLLRARQDKEATYPELTFSGRCKLVVLAMGTGGRWSEEAADPADVGTRQSARRTSVHAVLCGPPSRLPWWNTPLLAELFERDPR